MTEQIAIHCLKSEIMLENCEECSKYGETGTDHCQEDAIRLAIAALERQIPKKLIKKWDYTRGNHDFHRWTCSKCERDIEDISADYEYCPYCGQKIQWGE